MEKLLKYIGLLVFICFSFFYTEKTIEIIKEKDPIMISIKNLKKEENVKVVSAKIYENTIIPGLSSKVIDVDKSYYRMKKYGKFNEELLVYKKIEPLNTIKNNYNKYVIRGNKEKNAVSIIFKVSNNDNLTNVLEILKEKNVKIDFFVDGKWIENNRETFFEIINQKHNINNLGYNGTYFEDKFIKTNNTIKSKTKKDAIYCYTEKKDKEILNLCAKNKMNTIIPSIILTKYPLINLKKNLKSGDIISIEVNEFTEKELSLIINYINQKGFEIITLFDHLNEKR